MSWYPASAENLLQVVRAVVASTSVTKKRAVLRSCRTLGFSVCSPLPLRLPYANQSFGKARYDLVELCEVPKYTRRISGRHTSRRDVLSDDAACTNYDAAPDSDAGKDDRL
jgi:hypothetical protein